MRAYPLSVLFQVSLGPPSAATPADDGLGVPRGGFERSYSCGRWPWGAPRGGFDASIAQSALFYVIIRVVAITSSVAQRDRDLYY